MFAPSFQEVIFSLASELQKALFFSSLPVLVLVRTLHRLCAVLLVVDVYFVSALNTDKLTMSSADVSA